MITQDFSKPLETATVLQKIVLDKAEWVKNKEKRVGKFKNKENIIKYKTREIVEIKKKKKNIQKKLLKKV